MGNFDYAIAHILRHEGGFVCDPDDPGGATNFGISARFLERRGTKMTQKQIEAMTRGEAVEIYRALWKEYGCDNIADERKAAKYFDSCVNAGPSTATKILQRALTDLGFEVSVDGKFGSITFQALNAADYDDLLATWFDRLSTFYSSVANNPTRPHLKKFLKGWLKRAAFRG